MSSSVSRLPSPVQAPVANTRNVAPSLRDRGAPASSPGASGVSLFVDPRKAPKSAPSLGGGPRGAGKRPHTAPSQGGRVQKTRVYPPIYCGQYFTAAAGKKDAPRLDGFAKEFGTSEGNQI